LSIPAVLLSALQGNKSGSLRIEFRGSNSCYKRIELLLQKSYTDLEISRYSGEELSYHVGKSEAKEHSRKAGSIVNILPGSESKSCSQRIFLRLIAWASVAVGVAAVGLYVGHELRVRYKFNHRTPTDFYAHAGDDASEDFDIGAAEYGVGI
jgi:hypothetical protein